MPNGLARRVTLLEAFRSWHAVVGDPVREFSIKRLGRPAAQALREMGAGTELSQTGAIIRLEGKSGIARRYQTPLSSVPNAHVRLVYSRICGFA